MKVYSTLKPIGKSRLNNKNEKIKIYVRKADGWNFMGLKLGKTTTPIAKSCIAKFQLMKRYITFVSIPF